MIQPEVLLQILADGKYHSGEELGQQLSVSRAAIGKNIKKLEKNYKLNVFAVKGKGYRLQQPLVLLNKERIQSKLSQGALEKLGPFEIFFDIDSTNRYLTNKCVDGASSGYLVLAEQQTSGQGRRGRDWISPFASNLYMSLLWRFHCGAAQLACLSLYVAVALVRALQKTGVNDVGVKWPNDIYWNNKKLAGILLEMRGELSGPSAVVIGIGLNITMKPDSEESKKIDQPWVDVETMLGKKVDRNELTAFVTDALFDILKDIPAENTKLLEEWQQVDILKNQNIEITFADKVLTGKALGITQEGALRVQHDDQEVVYHSGEVSIRRGA